MNEVPPGQDEPDDVDELYRRASAGDDSRPSEWVRHAVLSHAAHLAAERARQTGRAEKAARREVHQTWRRPAIFGTLAAAALAGLLVAPHFLPPPTPNVAVMSQAPATSAPRSEALQYAAPPAALPQTASPPAALSPAAPSRSAPRAAPRAAPPQEAEERSSGMLAEERARSEGVADEQKLAKTAGASARNEATSPETAPSLAAKNAPAHLAGTTVTAQRAAAAPAADAAASAADAAAPADPGAQLRQAAETGNASELQRLLDKQSDIDARDDSGRTALLRAAQQGQAHAVDVLLAHGADPNAADSTGDTPLKAALQGHQQAIAAALRRAGAR